MSRRGWVLFTAMGVIWGIPYLLIKVADGGVSVAVLVFARVFAGTLLLLPIAIRHGQLRALRPYLRWLAAFAAVEVILPWLLLSSAERHLSSSLSGLLIAVVPVIGVGVAWLAGDRERLSATRWAGLAMGLAGVALLGGGISAGGDAWPVLQVLGTALCYSIGPVIADRKLAGADDLAVTAMSLALASVVYAPAAALTWPRVMPSVQVLGALAALAVVCTALAFVLYFRLIAEVGPVRATVITYVNPAVAVVLGAVVLGERITPALVISFALVLIGSVLATRAPRRLRPVSPVSPSCDPGEASPRETAARYRSTHHGPFGIMPLTFRRIGRSRSPSTSVAARSRSWASPTLAAGVAPRPSLTASTPAAEQRSRLAVTGRRTPAGCPAPVVMAILVSAAPAVRYPPRTGTNEP